MDSYNYQWSNPEECGKSISAKLQQIQHNLRHVQISWNVLYLKWYPTLWISSTINPVTFIDSHIKNILDGKLLFKDHKVTRDELLSWKP